MKNIILIGSSRSGKTTLARMIKEKNDSYNILHGDMIKKAFQSYSGETASNLKNNFEYRKFIYDIFYNHAKYNNGYYIIETVDIFPEDLINYDLSETIVIVLGCTKNTVDELLNIWGNIDNKWLLNKSKDELKIKAEKVIQTSKFFQTECKKYGIKFVDTSFNRESVLNNLLEELLMKI